MAKILTKKVSTPTSIPTPVYKSALCSMSAAAMQANKMHEDGYDIIYSFAVVAPNEQDEGKLMQAIYLLAKLREK
jgi:hypothetical protein